ncbi:FadR/GntR family transcriptional regulator [Marinibaculum pumilum]|uniref:FadR/GntR family transcriptional regulator n=1 Tax=Marinibaculum pumilum TaxID=1766165 RepID=A0ABV7KVI3_9PROT
MAPLPNDRVRSDIRRRIQSGDWSAGMRVPAERDLAAQLGAARNTVRRALTDLEAEGLIQRRGSRSRVVNGTEGGIDSESARILDADAFLRMIEHVGPGDVMEVRLLLEPHAAAMAASRAGPAELAAIRRAVEGMEAADTVETFEHWDGRFHKGVMDACRNGLLTHIASIISHQREMPEWMQKKRETKVGPHRALFDIQHRAILDAIASRDMDAAAHHMREHLLAVRDRVFAVV